MGRIIVSAVLLSVPVAIVILIWRERRKHREAMTGLDEAKLECMAKYQKVKTGLESLRLALAAWQKKTSAACLVGFDRAVAAAQTEFDMVSTLLFSADASIVKALADYVPTQAALSFVRDYARFSSGLDGVNTMIELGWSQAQSVKALSERVENGVRNATTAVQEAQAAVAQANGAGLATEGTIDGILLDSEASLAQAVKEKDDGLLATSVETSAKAVASANKAKQMVEALVKRKAELTEAFAEQKLRLSVVKALLAPRKEMLRIIKFRYQKSAWESVAGNNEVAEGSLAKAETALAECDKCLAQNDFDQAAGQLAEAESRLCSATELFGGIARLSDALQKKPELLKPEIAYALQPVPAAS